MPTATTSKLREFSFFVASGDQIGYTAMGHELDTSDPELFRVIRVAPDGSTRCTAVLNRRHISAVIADGGENEESTD